MNVNVWICFHFRMWRLHLHQVKRNLKGLIFVGFDFRLCLDAKKLKGKKCRLKIIFNYFFFFFKNWGRKINIYFFDRERLIFNLIMMLIWQSKWKSIWQKNHFLFWLLVILAFSINHLTIKTILTQYQKYRDQIKTIEN